MPTPEMAVVHPLVLLSVVDHYNRVAKDTKKRVVGVLLGENSKGRIEITNSFAGTYWSLHPAVPGLVPDRLMPVLQRQHFDRGSVQSHMRRTTGIPRSGSWTTATLRICAACSRRSTVSHSIRLHILPISC